MANVVYTQNRCPMKVLCSATPKGMWSGRRPCIVHMRIFGSLAYAIVRTRRGASSIIKESNVCFLDIART